MNGRFGRTSSKSVSLTWTVSTFSAVCEPEPKLDVSSCLLLCFRRLGRDNFVLSEFCLPAADGDPTVKNDRESLLIDAESVSIDGRKLWLCFSGVGSIGDNGPECAWLDAASEH